MQLLLALRVVSRVESSSVRATVFEDIAGRSRVIRLVLRLYHMAHFLGVSPLLIGLYGASYYVRAVLPAGRVPVLGVGFYANELKTLDLTEKLLAPQTLSRVGWKLVNPVGLFGLFSGIGHVKTTYRLARHIVKRHDFMPACRVMATLFMYIRFRQWYLAHGANAVIITSDYSPDGAAMTAAAKMSGGKAICIPHALPNYMVDRKNGLIFDAYVLQSEAMRDRLRCWHQMSGEIAYQGVRGSYVPLSLAGLEEGSIRIGILLSGATRLGALRDLISALLEQHALQRILIRGHPVDFANPDFGALTQLGEAVRISEGTSLEQDVAACDILISSNSTVMVDSLRMGKPTVFFDALDDLPYDYNGLVKDGLVPAMEGTTLDIESVRQFFGGGWEGRMRYFDSAYGKNREQVDADVSEILHGWVRAK